MKRFHQNVDLRSRVARIAFLAGHYRYDTMNSWNRSTSYANCIKVHTLDFTADMLERAWAMLDCPDVKAIINGLLADWAVEHSWQWQAGFNGRSGGYLVLYQGGIDHAAARTAQCDTCGAQTWHKAETPCTTDGCPCILRVLESPIPKIFTLPGKAVDMGEDFAEWDQDELRDRVRLVQSFDALCDRVVETFASFCRDYEVVDTEVPAVRTIKTLQPLEQGDSP